MPIVPESTAEEQAAATQAEGSPSIDIELAATLAEAARELATVNNVDAALRAVVDLAIESIACDSASITMKLSGGKYRTVAPSDAKVREADALQYELNEGPCVSALFTDGFFVVEDLEADARWPNWGPRAAELGLHSILSVHLYTSQLSVGAINLYAGRGRQYSEQDVEVAKLIAAHASAALAKLRVEQDLWAAIDARHLIGQAQGILMGQFSLTSEQSFSVLQRYSQRSNRKLREIAEIVVETLKLPDTGEQ